MRVLHFLYAGDTGGIEKLCKDIGQNSHEDKNYFFFVHSGGWICNEMRTLGLPTEIMGLRNKDVVKLYQAIREYADKLDADWLVVHHPAPLIWLAMRFYLCKKRRAKVAVYVHNTYLENVKQRWSKEIMYGSLLRKCDGVIAVSHYVKETILKHVNIPSEKITVIYNGICVQQYQTEYRSKVELPVKLIYVGRLIPQKGVQMLLQALSLVKCKTDYRLQIVGDGSYRKKLEKLTDNLGLHDIVTFEGVRQDVAVYLQNADVFVHPAVWEEGFGITIVEAMSAALVCIAYQKGAIPEIIENEHSGFIIKECDTSALAEQLEKTKARLLEDNLIEMRKAAKIRANSFSIENVIEELHQFYLKV